MGNSAITTTASPVSALRQSKVILFTRDATTADDTVGYTGVGFKPKTIIFTWAQASGANGLYWGMGMSGDDLTGSSVANNKTGVVADHDQSSGTIINVRTGGSVVSDRVVGALDSYDTDGFTISWTKVGTAPSGTFRVAALCLGGE